VLVQGFVDGAKHGPRLRIDDLFSVAIVCTVDDTFELVPSACLSVEVVACDKLRAHLVLARPRLVLGFGSEPLMDLDLLADSE
jgi:hypothetical protein